MEDNNKTEGISELFNRIISRNFKINNFYNDTFPEKDKDGIEIINSKLPTKHLTREELPF